MKKLKLIFINAVIIMIIAFLMGLGFSCTTPVDDDGGGHKPKPSVSSASSLSDTSSSVSSEASSETSSASPLTVTINQETLQTDPTNASPINFTVIFSEAVTDFETGDVSFAGSTAGGALVGTVTGSGTTYNVEVSGMTSDGTVIASIDAGVAHNAASDLNNASTSTDNIVTYDATVPDVSLSCLAPDPTNMPYVITITFSEPINPASFTAGDITFTSGSGSASDPTTSDNITWTSTITPATQGSVTVTIDASEVQDMAGNYNTAAMSPITRTWDTSVPGVSLSCSAPDPINTPYEITITFTEPIDPATFTAGDISFTSGTGSASAPSTSDNIKWYSTITPTSQGSVTVTIDASVVQDMLGNDNTAAPSPITRTWDTIFPDVSLSSSSPDPINVPYSITITFTEAINPATFTAGDITFISGSGSASAPSTSDNITWFSTITPASQGTVTVTIDASEVQDMAGNDNTASSSSITRTWDSISCDVSLISSVPDPTNTPYSITITFTEPIDPATFTAGDISFTMGTGFASTPSTSDNITWTTTITPTSQGVVTVTVNAGSVQDEAGNDCTEAPSPITTTWDTAGPDVSLSSSSPEPINVPYNITITFTEPIDPATFTAGDIAFTIGTGFASAPTTSDNITWTSTITPTSQGVVTVTVNTGAVQDALGYDNTAASSPVTRTWDTIFPDVSLSSSSPDPINVPYSITISFTEPIDPATFTAGDISFTSGTGSVSAPSTSDNITWFSTITPANQGTVTVTVNAAAVTDLAGNDNTSAPSSVTRTWDTIGPDTTITSVTQDRTGADPIPITITFSEAIDPVTFTAQDITVTNGTAGNLTSSDNITWTCDVTPISAGVLTVDINAGRVQDPAGNDNYASNTLNRTHITEVGYDGSFMISGGTSNTVNLSNVIVGNNSNRVLLVKVHAWKATYGSFTEVTATYGGTAMTLIPGADLTNGTNYNRMTTRIFYLNNPPAGTADVQVVFTTTAGTLTGSKIFAVSLYDTYVHSGTAYDEVQTYVNSAFPRRVVTSSISTNYDRSLVLDIVGGDRNNSTMTSSSQIIIQTSRNPVPPASVSTLQTTVAGIKNINWTFSRNQNYRINQIMAEIRIAQ